jgi:hypothetical protein
MTSAPGGTTVIEQALVFMVAVSLPLALVVEELVNRIRGMNRSAAAIRNPKVMEERHA